MADLFSTAPRQPLAEVLRPSTLNEVIGQTSVLAFKNFQKNPAQPANHFKFVMPKGADVINN